jgi:hypothetical protein
MPGHARPIAPYSLVEPRSQNRGQKRGLVRVDGRTVAGRLLKHTRKALLDHVGGPNAASTVQKALIERCAWLELRCALFDQKQIEGTFTNYDSATHLALIGSLRRLYQTLGIEKPRASFASLLGSTRRGRKPSEAAD